MNMKKNNKGFSLVELIVVIAIMAILAAVAVIGVSVYIPKAQKAADEQLVSDIVYAITLRDYETQFASNNNGVVGYVVVTEDGVKASGEDVIAALKALYGENYETSSDLRLAYDGWTDTIVMLNQVGADEIKEYIGSVNESTYITNVGTDKLLADVQNCATSFGTFLGKLYDDDTVQATNALIGGFADGDSVKNLLSQAGYSTEDDYADISKEALQNVTVFAVASTVANEQYAKQTIENFADKTFLGTAIGDIQTLDQVATWYAAAEAMVAYLNDPECTEVFAQIDMTSDNAGLILANMVNAQNTITKEIRNDQALLTRWTKYYEDDTTGKTQARKDGETYVAIMSSVNNLRSDYLNDQNTIKSDNLFANENMSNRVNTYISAANLADEIRNNQQLKELLKGKESAVVVIACATNGELDCMILPAEISN